MSGKIHKLKIIPGSKQESKFFEILKTVGVKPERVMCRRGFIFWTKYDEYLISDGLWKQIGGNLSGGGAAKRS